MTPLRPCSAASRLLASRLTASVASRTPAPALAVRSTAAFLSVLSNPNGIHSETLRHFSFAAAAATAPNRSFSSHSYGGGEGGGGGVGRRTPEGSPGRAYPQYSVWDSSSVLTMKPVLPTIKSVGRDGIAIDKRGYVLVEFVPRAAGGGDDSATGGSSASGSPLWDDRVRFGLSAEEVGLIVNQLPGGAGVELSRTGSQDVGGGGGGFEGIGASPTAGRDIPDKVLRFRPLEHGAVSFEVDLVKDGVSSGDNVRYPQVVTVQAGEFEMVMTLLRSTLPYLLGWTSMMNVDMAHRIALAKTGGGNYSGSGGGGSYL